MLHIVLFIKRDIIDRDKGKEYCVLKDYDR